MCDCRSGMLLELRESKSLSRCIEVPYMLLYVQHEDMLILYS